MEKIEFDDLPSATTPINSTNLNQLQTNVENAINEAGGGDINEILATIYPVGSIIIKDDDTDYSSWLGFTWQKVFEGKVLVGQDTNDTLFSTVGNTGGAKEHSHTIPEHIHNLSSNGWALANLSTSSNYVYAKQKSVTAFTYTNCQQVSANAIENSSDTTSKAIELGGATDGTSLTTDTANNLMPYQVVAYWKRTA